VGVGLLKLEEGGVNWRVKGYVNLRRGALTGECKVL